jgi:hypothetical protein
MVTVLLVSRLQPTSQQIPQLVLLRFYFDNSGLGLIGSYTN